jgi:hypothetical protein
MSELFVRRQAGGRGGKQPRRPATGGPGDAGGSGSCNLSGPKATGFTPVGCISKLTEYITATPPRTFLQTAFTGASPLGHVTAVSVRRGLRVRPRKA